jgi:hypothetical protein
VETRGVDEYLSVVQPRITQAMNEAMNEGLTRTFTFDEVDRALTQMLSLKTPGLMDLECVFSKNIGTQ